MKKNFVLKASVAALMALSAGSANAGSLATTFKTYASEVFGTGSAATAIQVAPLTYQFGVPVAAGQPIAIYVQLSGGAKFVAGKVAAANMSCLDAANAVVAATTGVISTDSTYAVFEVTPVAGFSTNSTCTYTPAAASIDNINVALSAAGGAVTATWTNDSGAAAVGGVPTGGTNIDTAGTHVGSIAQSAAAITGQYIASSAFPFTPVGGAATGVAETKKIDVAAATTAALFTAGANGVATNAVNLGAILFAETAGTQDDGTGVDYTIAKATATGLSAVITGDFSLAEAAAANKGVFFATDLACTTQTAAPAAGAVTYNAAKTTATISGITRPTVNVPYYVCMTVSPTNTTAITPTAYSATASLAKTAATELANTVASSPLLTTALNGSTVDVRNYVPAAVTGWTQYLRVINTGTVAAPISVSVINETTGAVSNSVVVIPTLAAGAVANLTSTDIEAAVGAQAATARPRIRVSGPTNALEVQNMLFTPNGSFSAMHSKE